MITVVFRTFIIYVSLNITLRILGKRQIGELEIAELVSTLLLSELATTVISDPAVPLAFSLLPILLIMSFELFTSDIKNRSPFLKRIFEGSPGVLIERGVLDQAALRRMRISVPLSRVMRTASFGMNLGSAVMTVFPDADCGSSSFARLRSLSFLMTGKTVVSINRLIKVDFPVRTGPTTPI